ncbi:MAG: ABC transporter substrate binding protein [Candidatus Cloacimonetes bacterium]|nr:ABC transporter substrate binding protein [Candidatus Cloacimonadota bacterium]
MMKCNPCDSKFFFLSTVFLKYGFLNFFLILFTALFPFKLTAIDNSTNKVLVLHSNHQGYKWTDSVQDAIATQLGSVENVEIYVEYLDAQRYSQTVYQEIARTILKERYIKTGKSFDVIMCVDDNALDFVIDFRSELFPEIPIVFCGINDFEPEKLKGQKNITGVNEKISVKETVDLAIRLRPQAQKLAVVSDATITGKRNLQVFKRIEADYSNLLKIEYLSELEPDQLKSQLKDYSVNDMILYLSYFKTPTGKVLSVEESVRFVTSSTNAAVFGCWDFLVPFGIAGGKVVHGYSQGSEAVNLVLEILGGRKADELPVIMESPNQIILNDVVLHHFHISENILPQDYSLINITAEHLMERWGDISYETFFGYEMFQKHGSIMVLLDPETGIILDANKSARNYYGYDQLIGLDIKKINHMSPLEVATEMKKAAKMKRNFFNFKHILSNGKIRNVEVYSYPVEIAGKKILFSIVHDVTEKIKSAEKVEEKNKWILLIITAAIVVQLVFIILLIKNVQKRKKIEFKLRENEAKFRGIFESAFDGIALHEIIYKDSIPVDYRILDVNPAFEKNTQVDRKKAIGALASTLYGIDKAPYLEDYAKVASGGEPLLKEEYFPPMDKYFRISAVSPRPGQFVTIFEDVSDSVKREKELQGKNTELNQFIYTVSHDLRSPLVTIKTFLGYAEEDYEAKNEESFRKDLSYIKNAADKMGKLLDELLNLSRIGRKTIPPEEIPLKKIVESAADIVAGRIVVNNATINFTGDNVSLFGDVQRLTELFQNLIDNSVKFRQKDINPQIDISAVSEETEVVITIKDNGIGIDNRFIGKLCEPFEKLDKNTDGVGMGLAICKKIVDIHEGSLKVDSEGENKGTTVLVTLKKKRINKTQSDGEGIA